MILKFFKYELYPTEEQKVLIEKHFGCARFVYNWALDLKKKSYEQKKKKLSYFDTSSLLTKKKQEERFLWLNEVQAQSLQMSLRNLDNAFTSFFEKQHGFPKFKSKHTSRKSFQYPSGVRIDFEKNEIHLPKLKNVKSSLYRKFEGKIKTCTVSKSTTNRYYISVLVETTDDKIEKKPVQESTTIGIDLGLKHFVITSNKEKFDNPRFLRKSEQRLKVLQRQLSKKKKGSKNREDSRFELARCHEHVRNQRKDYIHKITYKLTHENQVDTICMEDLNVEGMLKNHCLAKSISDIAWSEFRRQMIYKCDWYGKNIIHIGRFEPSSKTCSICGYSKKDLTLADREWQCPDCNTLHDRDENAATNIKKFGLIKQLGAEDAAPSINKAS
jgi:putative transposase